jgi:hypothetical protein
MAYPATIDSFTTKVDGVDDVLASHMNAVQTAIVNIETEFGTQPRHTATTAPTVNDDTGDGYSVGTLWLDTTNDRMYIAIDVSAGAAVWVEIGGLSGTWTPTVTQSGSVAVSVAYATYKVRGRTCHVEARLTVTGSGTGGNDIVIGGAPAAIQPTNVGANLSPIGVAIVEDAATAYYSGLVITYGAADWRVREANTRGICGTNPNFALASGDDIVINCTYDLA